MTEKTPPVLDRLWDGIPTGQAPIADLLHAGQAVKRRQRRTIAVGVAMATALILGVGALGTQALGGPQDRSGLVADGASDGSVKVLGNNGTADDQPCGPNDVCEKATRDAFTLDCHQGDSFEQATFDIFDDTAFSTPERAVVPMLAADERASAAQEADAGKVRIALLRADGTTRAVVTVEKIQTGWRPSTINGCPGEMTGPQQR